MCTLILKIWRMDMKVRIYMGAVRRFFLKRRLLKMKFSLRKSHGMQYFQRHIEDHNKTEIKKIVKFCKHRLLRYSLYDDSMERSSTYRYRFFRERRGVPPISSVALCLILLIASPFSSLDSSRCIHTNQIGLSGLNTI